MRRAQVPLGISNSFLARVERDWRERRPREHGRQSASAARTRARARLFIGAASSRRASCT
jgi:hypothetical protein